MIFFLIAALAACMGGVVAIVHTQPAPVRLAAPVEPEPYVPTSTTPAKMREMFDTYYRQGLDVTL